MTVKVTEAPARPLRKSIKRKLGNGLKRKSGPSKRRVRVSTRKRKTKTDLWREFGLVRPAKPRYSGLRGVLWHVLSLYVRQRDLKLWGPVCINCGQEKTDFQGGHFIATGSCGWDGLALDPENIHAECSSCNFRDKQKLNYGFNLDRRYGPGTADRLRERYRSYRESEGHKNWSNAEYREKILHYQALMNGQTTA